MESRPSPSLNNAASGSMVDGIDFNFERLHDEFGNFLFKG